jgi:hypothetical protein
MIEMKTVLSKIEELTTHLEEEKQMQKSICETLNTIKKEEKGLEKIKNLLNHYTHQRIQTKLEQMLFEWCEDQNTNEWELEKIDLSLKEGNDFLLQTTEWAWLRQKNKEDEEMLYKTYIEPMIENNEKDILMVYAKLPTTVKKFALYTKIEHLF